MSRVIDRNKYYSSTQLKNNTKSVLDATDSLGEVFIMNNNKPRAVLISVQQYNSFIEKQDNFRVIGDIIPMSAEDVEIIKKGREEYKKGNFLSEEEVFKELME